MRIRIAFDQLRPGNILQLDVYPQGKDTDDPTTYKQVHEKDQEDFFGIGQVRTRRFDPIQLQADGPLYLYVPFASCQISRVRSQMGRKVVQRKMHGRQRRNKDMGARRIPTHQTGKDRSAIFL